MKRILIAGMLVLVLGLAGCDGGEAGPLPTATVEPTAVPGALYVDPSVVMHEISPLVFGSNYGPWISVPADMMEEAFASEVTMLRFPGGEWGDRNDTKTYHVDAFMAFCEQLGADVNFTVRLLDGTPEAAAEMVRYVNIEQDYGVHYWTVGNEPTLYADFIDDSYDTVRFNEEWRALAEAMKDVDDSILVLGPELHQFNSNSNANPKDENGLDWMIEFLEANGDYVDVVSFHRYPFPRTAGQNASIEDLREDAAEWERTIIYLRGLIHEISGRDIPIAITEFNSHYTKSVGGEGTPDSHYNAIWLGNILGRMIRQNVLIGNQWMLTSWGGYGGWGLVTRGDVLPTYYVYQMYAMFGDTYVFSSSDDANLQVFAALRGDDELTIMVVNMEDDAREYPIEVAGDTGMATYWLFDESHDAEFMGEVDLGGGMVFPEQSMTLIVVPLE